MPGGRRDKTMARWRPLTWHYLTNFNACGFRKYWVVSFRAALLKPANNLRPSHNLLVREFESLRGTKAENNRPQAYKTTRPNH